MIYAWAIVCKDSDDRISISQRRESIGRDVESLARLPAGLTTNAGHPGYTASPLDRTGRRV